MLGKIFGAFVEGFCEGFARETTGQASRTRGGPDFRQWVPGIAQELGLEVCQLDPEAAACLIQAGSNYYGVGLHDGGNRVLIHLYSTVKFPPRQVPGEVARFLAERNKELPRFDWDVSHCTNFSSFYVKCALPYAALSARSLAAALEEMGKEVMTLDHGLAKLGLAS